MSTVTDHPTPPLPPGPRSSNPLRTALAFQRTPLEFLGRHVAEFGDISRFRLFHMPFVVLNRPEFVKHVLQDNHANYDKDVFLFKITKPLFGEGLVTSAGGDPWLRQRRLVQPAFHRDRLAGFASTMVQAVQEMLESWARQPDSDPQVSLTESIIGLTMQIACRTLISVDDFGPHIERFADSFLTIDRALSDFARMPFPPLGFPTAGHRRMWNALKRVDDIVYGIIAERRRRSDTSADDVLSMLMHAVDEETGTGMTDRQLRDELVTILIAGFETTANALCWTLIELDRHPEVTARLIEEVDTVLAGRPPAVDDLAGLTYTRMVLQEALRLHTPSWQLMRHARADDEIGGCRIPRDSIVFWTMTLLHRHPEFWDHPTEFDPEHFAPEKVAERPRYAYVPFSSGPRQCVGNGFAMMEMTFALAMILQRYRFSLTADQTIIPEPLLTLRPSGRVLATVTPRS